VRGGDGGVEGGGMMLVVMVDRIAVNGDRVGGIEKEPGRCGG
jgi:hypothetical protein